MQCRLRLPLSSSRRRANAARPNIPQPCPRHGAKCVAHLIALPKTQHPAQKLTKASSAAKKARHAANAVAACHCWVNCMMTMMVENRMPTATANCLGGPAAQEGGERDGQQGGAGRQEPAVQGEVSGKRARLGRQAGRRAGDRKNNITCSPHRPGLEPQLGAHQVDQRSHKLGNGAARRDACARLRERGSRREAREPSWVLRRGAAAGRAGRRGGRKAAGLGVQRRARPAGSRRSAGRSRPACPLTPTSTAGPPCTRRWR